MPTAQEYRVKAAELLTKAKDRKGKIVDECIRLAYGYMRLADHADTNQSSRCNSSNSLSPVVLAHRARG